MQQKKILLVDDVKFFLELEKSFLKRTDCDVVTASNGQEALDILKSETIDLVLMDLYMPEMNGDDACKIMKSDPELRNIPIIMVTKAGNDDEKGRCLMAGCDEFITKPINKMELLAKIKTHLNVMVRQYVRAPIDAEVTIIAEGKEYSGTMHDISEGGMFIINAPILPMQSTIVMKFNLQESEYALEAEGRVVREVKNSSENRAHLRAGMGIQFTMITAETRRSIAEYVKAGNYIV